MSYVKVAIEEQHGNTPSIRSHLGLKGQVFQGVPQIEDADVHIVRQGRNRGTTQKYAVYLIPNQNLRQTILSTTPV